MKDDSTHIRVKVATRERLLRLIESLTVQSERSLIPDHRDCLDNPNPHANAVSFDVAINFLLNIRDKHRQRADKSAATRKAARSKDAKTQRNTGS